MPSRPSVVPAIRVRPLVDAAVNPAGRYVFYWMIAFRRTRFNFALQRAVEWCRELSRPLVVLEGLGCRYPWASDRFHAFIIQGMRDNADRFERAGVLYIPYVEPERGAGKGLVERLARKACVVVSDDFPEFALPRLLERAAAAVRVRFECVDSNGLLPLAETSKVFATAFAFRRHLQNRLPEHLGSFPQADPLRALPGMTGPSLAELLKGWPAARLDALVAPSGLRALPIDHEVGPVAGTMGGAIEAGRRLKRFGSAGLARYGRERNHADSSATSGLSPYLHFGHIGSHEVFQAVVKGRDWSASPVGRRATGRRTGWWKLDAAREEFLDQLVTWRELGFNMSRNRPDHARYEELPAWARRTLDAHARDRRDYVYDLRRFEAAETHDPVWNAAQRQLRRAGTIAGYLRMLWGKKILEWSAAPTEALDIMIELNNKYALDGRDPNSYSGIFWCLGRYDRPWGPERPIYGTVRYMTTAGALRKTRMKEWLARYGEVSESRLR